MTTSLARLKDGYTNGGRSVALRFMQSFRSDPADAQPADGRAASC